MVPQENRPPRGKVFPFKISYYILLFHVCDYIHLIIVYFYPVKVKGRFTDPRMKFYRPCILSLQTLHPSFTDPASPVTAR